VGAWLFVRKDLNEATVTNTSSSSFFGGGDTTTTEFGWAALGRPGAPGRRPLRPAARGVTGTRDVRRPLASAARAAAAPLEIVARRRVVIGREGVRAGGLVIVVPRVGPAAGRLTRLGGRGYLLVLSQSFKFVGTHTPLVDPRRARNLRDGR
jgi:hypothetical protein